MSGLAGTSRRGGFTLVELLIVIAIIAALVGVLLPGLSGVRQMAMSTACKSNLRAIGLGIKSYAGMNRGLYPPLADWRQWPTVYWWGENGTPPDFARGPLVGYLDNEAGIEDGLFECPAQPWGTYVPQGATPGPTTTYGYNGYYLCPRATPGWASSIGHRPWRTSESVKDPGKVFMVADTLMAWGRGVVSNNCLLDPPWTFSRGRWTENRFTTLCFRHMGRANVCFADGHVESVLPTRLVDAEAMTGYVGESNAPHYVPDWEDW